MYQHNRQGISSRLRRLRLKAGRYTIVCGNSYGNCCKYNYADDNSYFFGQWAIKNLIANCYFIGLLCSIVWLNHVDRSTSLRQSLGFSHSLARVALHTDLVPGVSFLLSMSPGICVWMKPSTYSVSRITRLLVRSDRFIDILRPPQIMYGQIYPWILAW